MRFSRLLGVWAAAILFSTLAAADRAQVGVWMSPGGPFGIWDKTRGDAFPVKLIVADLAELGVTDIFFFEQTGRGGAFLHPTSVQFAATEKRMRGRDWLGELLEATAAPGIRVWLAWTTPGKEYPGTQFRGLDHPALQKIYLDEIEEVAARYGRYRNLAGIMWHEVDCSEHPDMHEDDRDAFSAFCRREFGQPYTAAPMPPPVDPQDPAWRRFALYKIHVVNELVRRTAEAAARHGLRTHFCSYMPEGYRGESWRWGYDVVALERFCDQQWFSAYSIESGKAAQRVRGAWLDFGPSYKGQILARNYAYMFHGGRPSYFEYRTPVYIEPVRRYYAGIKSFAEKYGDFYSGYVGHSDDEVALFYGKENLGAWLRAATAWQGGRSTAAVAVAVHPTPFVLAHPASPGGEYEKKVRALMVALSRITDVDALLLQTRHALDVRNLLAYRLLVIPEDMGRLLSAEMAAVLRQYLAQGGKLLVMATGLSQGRQDLVGQTDLSVELCGVEIAGAGLPGYVEADAAPLGAPRRRFWAGQRVPIRLHGAEVVVRESADGQPLLVQRGNVTFSSLGFSPEGTDYFQAVVRSLVQAPVRLKAEGDLRVLEGVAKDQRVCLSLWGRGQGRLAIDAPAFGLRAPACQVTDIVTGASLGQPSADELSAGIPLEIKYPNQPLIVVVSASGSGSAPKGLYASVEVFRNLPARESTENPEVPHEAAAAAPDTAAPAAVAVRDKELGLLSMPITDETPSRRRALEQSHKDGARLLEEAGIKPEPVETSLFLPAGKAERNRYKRIFVPGATGRLPTAVLEGMDDYVRSGGLLVTAASLILLDAGDGTTRYASDGFLGVFGHGGCVLDRVTVTRDCPLTAGLPQGWFALDPPASGRRTTIRSAETLMLGAGSHRDGRVERQPFLTFKHTGRGAAIYLVGQVGPKSDPRLKQILKNTLAPATLRWLCGQS